MTIANEREHSSMMLASRSLPGEPSATDADAPRRGPISECRELRPAPTVPSFEEIYDTYVDFVYRSVRRLGVSGAAAEDVTQDVFITIHRRLSSFEGRSTLRTWIFGVVTGVVRNHRRRSAKHRPMDGEPETHLERAEAPAANNPDRRVERREAVRTLHAILDQMDEDKRELFVLAELEQVPAAEIAELSGTKLFTVYSRLRAARAAFQSAADRFRASDGWRMT